MYRLYDSGMNILSEHKQTGRYLFVGVLDTYATYMTDNKGTKYNLRYASNWRPGMDTAFELGAAG